MEIKNLFTPEAQKFGSQLAGVVKKVVQPLEKPIQEVGQQFSAKVQPEIQRITDTVKTSFVDPVMKPIERQGKISKVNKLLASKGITVDDIKNLAEADGSDPEEALKFFRDNGIKIEGMDELQAQEQEAMNMQAEQPTDFSGRGLAVNPEYDEVNALGNLTANIPKFQSEGDDSLITSIGKTIGNFPSNAIQVGAAVGDTGLSYLRNLDQGPIDALTETAKAKIINPTYQQALGVADIAKKGYEKGLETPYSWAEGGVAKKRGAFGGVLGATEALTKKGTEFVVENPIATIGMAQGVKNLGRGKEAIKTAGTEAMKGNVGKATAGLAKSAGIGLKETLYDPVKMGVTAPIKLGVAGVKGVSNLVSKGVSKGVEKAGISSPLSQEYVKAKTEAGTEFEVENTPTLGKNITDKLFKKENEILAQQSVFPKSTKEKTTKARLEASKIALDGIKQLYEDKANGIVKSDIRDMGGGVDGVLEGVDYHGKRIGEITKDNPSIIDANDLIKTLKESLDAPFSDVNPGMKATIQNIVKAFEKAENKADISTLQEAMSNIKSEIFDNRENIAKLYKTSTGRALNEFLKNIEERFNTTIENTSGNSLELKNEKTAYSKYKKIQKDLTDSYMVELRNQGKGITGTAGKVAGLYEVLSNPSLSGVFKAIALKQAGETMQYYKSRAGNYETLIRNLDRESVSRGIPNKSKNGNN